MEELKQLSIETRKVLLSKLSKHGGNIGPNLGIVVNQLVKEIDIHASLINPKFITGLDEELLNSLKENHKLVITLEDRYIPEELLKANGISTEMIVNDIISIIRPDWM